MAGLARMQLSGEQPYKEGYGDVKMKIFLGMEEGKQQFRNVCIYVCTYARALRWALYQCKKLEMRGKGYSEAILIRSRKVSQC